MWQDLILVFDLADIEAVEVSPEDGSDQFGLFFHDGDLAVLHLIAKGQVAPDPQALALGGRDLVPDPLRGDLPFELGKGQQHVQCQPAHRCRGIELLGHGDERE